MMRCRWLHWSTKTRQQTQIRWLTQQDLEMSRVFISIPFSLGKESMRGKVDWLKSQVRWIMFKWVGWIRGRRGIWISKEITTIITIMKFWTMTHKKSTRMRFRTKMKDKIMRDRILTTTNSEERIRSPMILKTSSLHKSQPPAKNPKNAKASCRLPLSSPTLLTPSSVPNPKTGANSTATSQKPKNKTEWPSKDLQNRNSPCSSKGSNNRSWKWSKSTSRIRILSILYHKEKSRQAKLCRKFTEIKGFQNSQCPFLSLSLFRFPKEKSFYLR